MIDTTLASERAAPASAGGAKVSSLSKYRERAEAKKHKANRLAMLMAKFLEADAADDEAGKQMYGRGLSGYTRTELNKAFAAAKRAGIGEPA